MPETACTLCISGREELQITKLANTGRQSVPALQVLYDPISVNVYSKEAMTSNLGTKILFCA